MSILDDAIREHLELKRAHGADEGDLKRLEDEAFGPPQRPDEADPFAEAPTEFLTSPGEEAAEAPAIGDEDERGGRRPDIADLQEAPGDSLFFDGEAAEAPVPEDAPPPAPPEDELSPAPDAPPPSPSAAVDAPPPPPAGEAPVDLAPPTDAALADVAPPAPEAPAAPQAPEPPTAEEHPAGEHEIVPDHGPDTEERHVIADQPTQMFDVQAHVDAEAAAEQASPTDEELVDAAQDEPHAAPPAPASAATPFVPPTDEEELPPLESRGPDAEIAGHPPAETEPEEESAEYDFFNEQRLSEELDQALEAPTEAERNLPQYDDAAPEDGSAIFDFESHTGYEEDPSEEVLRRADAREAESAELPAPDLDEPPSEEFPATVEQQRPNFDPPSEETAAEPAEPPSAETPHVPEAGAEPDSEEDDYDFDPETGHEDVLEDTPRFLEGQPEDDDLWFEQRPPKDFDLD